MASKILIIVSVSLFLRVYGIRFAGFLGYVMVRIWVLTVRNYFLVFFRNRLLYSLDIIMPNVSPIIQFIA